MQKAAAGDNRFAVLGRAAWPGLMRHIPHRDLALYSPNPCGKCTKVSVKYYQELMAGVDKLLHLIEEGVVVMSVDCQNVCTGRTAAITQDTFVEYSAGASRVIS